MNSSALQMQLTLTSNIIFMDEDHFRVIRGHDDPMVIFTMIVNVEVKGIVVDQGSSMDILFKDAFDKLGL